MKKIRIGPSGPWADSKTRKSRTLEGSEASPADASRDLPWNITVEHSIR